MKKRNKREFIQLLSDNGFKLVRTRGDHEVWKRNNKEMIAIPKHEVNFMIQHRLIKGYKLKGDKYDKL